MLPVGNCSLLYQRLFVSCILIVMVLMGIAEGLGFFGSGSQAATLLWNLKYAA